MKFHFGFFGIKNLYYSLKTNITTAPVTNEGEWGLAEVEKFIQINKHLPNIPTEKELLKTGVNTGKMLKLQMAKIEELTLYIIALEKRMKLMEK